jgi:hypothetical protein
LLQNILPAPAPPSPSDFRRSRAADDAGDPVGRDPAILWHGGAYRLPQAPRPAAPAPAVTPVAAERQRFGLYYSRRPAPAPAPQPQLAVPPAATPVAVSSAPAPHAAPPVGSPPQAVAPEPPARETRSRTGSLPPPMQQ